MKGLPPTPEVNILLQTPTKSNEKFSLSLHFINVFTVTLADITSMSCPCKYLDSATVLQKITFYTPKPIMNCKSHTEVRRSLASTDVLASFMLMSSIKVSQSENTRACHVLK
ncbi:hypothetical protein E2C01_047544 [Portunus trituberculatus]|uniref:Uncharacterized protein n=1 Tax=Portunus trituberculatus TaxID=210409 RepID=A0A5B7G872_PORTR|nr:hypothetical protein [Portunus trituberculatus]